MRVSSQFAFKDSFLQSRRRSTRLNVLHFITISSKFLSKRSQHITEIRQAYCKYPSVRWEINVDEILDQTRRRNKAEIEDLTKRQMGNGDARLDGWSNRSKTAEATTNVGELRSHEREVRWTWKGRGMRQRERENVKRGQRGRRQLEQVTHRLLRGSF